MDTTYPLNGHISIALAQNQEINMQFFKATTVAQAQTRVDALRHAAKLLGVEVPPLSAAQQMIARENGFTNWAAFKAAQEQRVDGLLIDVEKAHARDSMDESGKPMSYGDESYINLVNGFSLRFGIENDLLSHARVTDPLGREILYYVDDEITESPLEVIRALLVCASRDAQSTASFTAANGTGDAVSIEMLSAAEYNGYYYNVRWTETTVTDPTDDVMCLHYTEDGLEYEKFVTLEELQSLTWDSAKKAYVSGDGDTFVFYVNSPVAIKVPS